MNNKTIKSVSFSYLKESELGKTWEPVRQDIQLLQPADVVVVVVEVVVVELLFSATQLFLKAATPPRVEESLFPREEQLCFCPEAQRRHVVSVCSACDTVVRGSESPRSQLSSR